MHIMHKTCRVTIVSLFVCCSSGFIGTQVSSNASNTATYAVRNIAPFSTLNFQPTSLSDRGEIVGRAWGPLTHAFAYYDEHMYDLGAPKGRSESQALGVNSSGTILASAWNKSGQGGTGGGAQRQYVAKRVGAD